MLAILSGSQCISMGFLPRWLTSVRYRCTLHTLHFRTLSFPFCILLPCILSTSSVRSLSGRSSYEFHATVGSLCSNSSFVLPRPFYVSLCFPLSMSIHSHHFYPSLYQICPTSPSSVPLRRHIYFGPNRTSLVRQLLICFSSKSGCFPLSFLSTSLVWIASRPRSTLSFNSVLFSLPVFFPNVSLIAVLKAIRFPFDVVYEHSVHFQYQAFLCHCILASCSSFISHPKLRDHFVARLHDI